jgi:hypothetical protein
VWRRSGKCAPTRTSGASARSSGSTTAELAGQLFASCWAVRLTRCHRHSASDRPGLDQWMRLHRLKGIRDVTAEVFVAIQDAQTASRKVY